MKKWLIRFALWTGLMRRPKPPPPPPENHVYYPPGADPIDQ